MKGRDGVGELGLFKIPLDERDFVFGFQIPLFPPLLKGEVRGWGVSWH